MCGITGLFGASRTQTTTALDVLSHRGRDEEQVVEVQGGFVGHVLHAVTGYTKQPVVGEGVLLFNGQIYNWQQLAKQEGIVASSDTQVLLYLLDNYSLDAVRSRLDGVYAFAYLRGGELLLERDLLGVKPLFYAHEDGVFGFASEPKALRVAGLRPRELHPRTTLRYVVGGDKVSSSTRELAFGDSSSSVSEALLEAVRKRIPASNEVGVLFSGGLDSGLLALLAKQLGAAVTLYVAALEDPVKKEPADLTAARSAADELSLPLVEVRASLADVEEVLGEVCSLIEDSNVVKVGVALPFFFACKQARVDGQRVLLSGLGAEEVFAGYSRHKQALDINQECLRGLRAMHERDLFRDDVVSMRHTLELRLPFLDYSVVAAGLVIPGEQKIVEGVSKVPLRIAAKELGLPASIADRPKKAAQYGSQFDAALDKLARRAGFSKSEYLRSLYPSNARLCSLLSGGKDSVYALHLMQRMNYEVACCATVFSENKDSYMFHTPALGFARLQAQAMGLPLLEQSSAGEKEEELADLRSVLKRAVEEHSVDGVVSGALFSNYQRERIERVCEELGLQVFAPLWHLDQEMEVREVLDAGFSFVLSKVAAEGLDGSWVGREITHGDVDRLSGMLGLNVAGEGGEYESLVLDGPNFSSRIVLEDVEVVCEREGSVSVCELFAQGRLE